MLRVDREIGKILEKYGRTITFMSSGKTESFKAFLQPLRYKNKMYLSAVSTDLCYDSTGKYLLICPATFPIGDANGYDAVISDGEKKFSTDRCETIYFGENPAYCWSIVTEL